MTTDIEVPLVPVPAAREPRSLYRYSEWLHVGDGAEDCPSLLTGCVDDAHVHAWCRLPNPLQEREIRERALAAKARKRRQLLTEGTDLNEILEGELDAIAAEGDAAIPTLVTELLSREWWKDYLEAVREVRDLDDTSEGAEEGAKLYAHIEEDKARFARLAAQDPADRNADEFDELQAHIKAHDDAVDKTVENLTSPRRAVLEASDINDLIDQTRRKRIETIVSDEFMHHFSIHSWLSCTYRQRDGQLFFTDLAQLENAAPEVLLGLRETYADLERVAQEAQGN